MSEDGGRCGQCEWDEPLPVGPTVAIATCIHCGYEQVVYGRFEEEEPLDD